MKKIWAFVLVVLSAPGTLSGQQASVSVGWSQVTPGSVMEDYLRALIVAGRAEPTAWSIRPLSPDATESLLRSVSEHPWAARYDLGGDPQESRIQAVWPEARMWYNSRFPFGSNDGPVWAGRGLTVSASGGGTLRWGPLSIAAIPEVFWSQNRSFTLGDTGRDGVLRFGDPWLFDGMDRPQRFGDDPYVRIDPGQSFARLDIAGATIGLSTTNQQWGPAQRHPMILGTNAAGFPHLFVGTSAPAGTPIGKVHVQAMWGRLADSGYNVLPPEAQKALAAGLVAVYVPRGLDQLEIGGSRFFHLPWRNDGYFVERMLKPFDAILKVNTSDPLDQNPDLTDDQLASVFFRWTAAESGFEFYGEYGREDHNWDLRDFLLEPDHTGGYVLGLQKVSVQEGGYFWAFRGELLNTQISHLEQIRLQQPFYIGGVGGMGHTHRGQLLASEYGPGGSAGLVEVDRYSPDGRWRFSIARNQRDYHARREPTEERDVLNTFGAEWQGWRRGMRVVAGAVLGYNQNRHYTGDALNLNATLGATYQF